MAKPSCVLAFSGGLDTSAIVPWLLDRGYEVHALAVDVGQHEDWDAVERRAIELGAASFTVRHVSAEMAGRMLPLAIGLGATYEGSYRLGTALARPIIALEQVKLARALGCSAVAHGATGKGNDQIRFEFAYRSLAPELEVIAPWKIWDFQGRQDLVDYLQAKGFPFEFEVNKTYSLDENLWHLSVEGGPLEDPASPLPLGDVLGHVVDQFVGEPLESPAPQQLTLTFEQGVPTAIDGVPLDLEALVKRLNGWYRHAGWAYDLVLENRFTGVKSRGVYINPAAKLLHTAIDALARNCLNKPTFELHAELGKRYAGLLYKGEYFSQQRQVIEAAGTAAMQPLSGKVTVQVDPALFVAAVDAETPLFRQEVATFEASDFSHADAAGFIELSWLGNVGGAPSEELEEESLKESDHGLAAQ